MEHRRRSVIWPLILIAIGIIALLANLGYLPGSVWLMFLRFWPLILILIGLEVLVGRQSNWGAVVVFVVGLLLIAGVAWLAMNPASVGFATTGATTTEQLTQSLGDAKSATIEISARVSETTVRNLDASSPNLAEGTLNHPNSSRIVKSFDVVGGNARLKIREEGNIPFLWGDTSGKWNLALSPKIPLTLNVNAGVGKVVLDLNALTITRVDLNAGVGEIQATMPSHAGTVVASVSGGVGAITVLIPQGVAARIRANAGLGGVRVNESRFPRIGENVYQSADYATASNRIDLDVSGGVGAVSVQ
jgi:predicted membrane protein